MTKYELLSHFSGKTVISAGTYLWHRSTWGRWTWQCVNFKVLNTKARDMTSEHKMPSKTLPRSYKLGPKTQSHKMKGHIIIRLFTENNHFSVGLNRHKEQRGKLNLHSTQQTQSQMIIRQSLPIHLYHLPTPNQGKNFCAQGLSAVLRANRQGHYTRISNTKRHIFTVSLPFPSCYHLPFWFQKEIEALLWWRASKLQHLPKSYEDSQSQTNTMQPVEAVTMILNSSLAP